MYDYYVYSREIGEREKRKKMSKFMALGLAVLTIVILIGIRGFSEVPAESTPTIEVFSTVASREPVTVHDPVAACEAHIIESADFDRLVCTGLQEDDPRLDDAYHISRSKLLGCIDRHIIDGVACEYGTIAQQDQAYEDYENDLFTPDEMAYSQAREGK